VNILLVSTHLNVGGITSYLYALARQYIKRGHRVYLASSGGAREDEFQKLGVVLFHAPLKTKSEVNPKVFYHVPRFLRFIKDHGIEVIHAHTRVTQVLGQVLSWFSGVPYVSTCHGFYKKRWFRLVFPSWGRAAVAISPPVKEHLIRDFRMPPQRVFLIQNGIDIEAFYELTEDRRTKTRENFNISKAPILGMVSRLADTKGHAVLINAMPLILRKFPQAFLFIAGEGKMEAKLKKQVTNMDLQDHVRFAPVFNPSGKILSLFDIFVMPSLDEGFGLSGMEAQVVGLPVVASDVGGIPTFVHHEKTGLLVPPGDPVKLAEAIIRLIEDKELAARLGRQARRFICENFSSAVMAEKTLNMYQSVCIQKETRSNRSEK